MENNRDLRILYKLSAWSAAVLFLYSLSTLFVVALIGPPPSTIQDCFNMLHENTLHGLLRLDLLTVFAMPLYYVMFLGLHFALRRENFGMAIVSTSVIFAGVTRSLAGTFSGFFLSLSEKFYNASTDTQKSMILAAGEALLSTDIWHGTGPRLGGLLIETGSVIFSFMMFKAVFFGKLAAYAGIITHGLLNSCCSWILQ